MAIPCGPSLPARRLGRIRVQMPEYLLTSKAVQWDHRPGAATRKVFNNL